jgi:pimeloyl-ACP methyl ester carboxylesterase
MHKVLHWIVDYAHIGRHLGKMYVHRNPPEHYLGHIVPGKEPVILLAGISNTWRSLKKIGDKISLEGHPVYIIPQLSRGFTSIPDSAKIVEDIIDENGLKNIIIVAHSKGGLIGKYLLIHDRRVKKLIAIATPFAGSTIVKFIPHKSFKELSPKSQIIADLSSHPEVNKNITSIIPAFDNHVFPKGSSYLSGGKNIKINVAGHHKILFDDEVTRKVLDFLSARDQEKAKVMVAAHRIRRNLSWNMDQ